MASKNYRKITVGDNFSSCIAYVVGANYLGRTIKITDIVPSPDLPTYLDVYVKSNKLDANAKTIWKTIPEKQILEIEYDLSFN